MFTKLHLLFQYILPHQFLSRLMGKLAESRIVWWKNLFIRTFMYFYPVDMTIALEPHPENYNNFNAFFTRALKPEVRPVVSAHNALACPVDGYLSQLGKIQHGKIFQAKNQYYELTQLFGGMSALAQPFLGGNFATLYLAPQNYHRVHMPFAGTLQRMIYVPGKLFSVNPATVKQIPGLFARNERVITVFDTIAGPMAVILVGAMIVGSIETVWTNAAIKGKKVEVWQYEANTVTLEKGAELGLFKMGSTVILLLGTPGIEWENNGPENAVRMGELLGKIEL